MFWFLLSFILLYIMILSHHYRRQNTNQVNEHQVLSLLESYIRQTLKWSYMSIVEKDPLKAISYSNYSVATLIGLKEYMKIFGIPKQIVKSLIGEDLSVFENKIIHIQNYHNKQSNI